MNESSEMFAGEGAESTFSFLHLSLQEYLTAWHLANSYSVEFQVAYYGLAVLHMFGENFREVTSVPREEEALLESLVQQ